MDWLPGDILAFHGTDLASQAVKFGTAWPIDLWGMHSPPTHVGIMAEGVVSKSQFAGNCFLVESTTLSQRKCLYADQPIQGVQVHFPMSRVADYVKAGGRVDVYRLTRFNQLLRGESAMLTAMVHIALNQRLRYDMRGAIFSATRASALLRPWLYTDVESVFCSELIACILQRLGLMSRWRIPSFYNPARLIRELLRTGVYERCKTWEQQLRLLDLDQEED